MPNKKGVFASLCYLIMCFVIPRAAQAQQTILDFSSLPNNQGWVFKTNNTLANVTEATVFSLCIPDAPPKAPQALCLDSRAVPFNPSDGSAMYYYKSLPTDITEPFVISVRARVLDELVDPSNSTSACGFAFGVNTGMEAFGVCIGLTPPRIQTLPGPAVPTPPGFNPADWHDYRLLVAPHAGFQFFIDSDPTPIRTGSGIISNDPTSLTLGDQSSFNAVRAEIARFDAGASDTQILGQLNFASSGETLSHTLAFQQHPDGDAIIWIPDFGEAGLQFKSSAVGPDGDRVTFRSNGSVGIGTTHPSAKLEVNGNIKISGAGNGLIFPDGTVQTTAQVAGPAGQPGPPGPKGDKGDPGPTGPPGPTEILNFTSLVRVYTGSIQAKCPNNSLVVTASCRNGNDVVVNGQNSPSNVGAWQSWLVPNPDNATGVHCSVGPGTTSTLILRCSKLLQ